MGTRPNRDNTRGGLTMSEEQLVEQTEEPALVETEQVDNVEVSESETATDKTEDKPDLQKVIAEKAFEAREQKRRAEELERRLQEIEANQPKETQPLIPPIPDPYDDDYEDKIRLRDEALVRQAEFNAREQERQQQAQVLEQTKQQQRQQELTAKAQEYSKRALALGVEAQELAQAGERIKSDVSEGVAGYILGHEKGPLITKYLAANPLELDVLSKLNPEHAGAYLEMQVKPKAEQYGTKKPTQAPEPVETLNSSGPSSRPRAGGTFY